MKVISPFWFTLYINRYHVTHINVFYIYNIYIYTHTYNSGEDYWPEFLILPIPLVCYIPLQYAFTKGRVFFPPFGFGLYSVTSFGQCEVRRYEERKIWNDILGLVMLSCSYTISSVDADGPPGVLVPGRGWVASRVRLPQQTCNMKPNHPSWLRKPWTKRKCLLLYTTESVRFVVQQESSAIYT